MTPSQQVNEYPEYSASPPPRKKRSLPRILSSFSSHDFRWLSVANVMGSMAMTMEMLTTGWLILELTDSPFWVGVAAGIRGTAVIGFGSIGGVLSDRYSRRNLIIIAQSIRVPVMPLVAFLVYTQQIELWHVLSMVALQGTLAAVWMPANNSLTYDVTGPSLVLNANAARLSATNLARLLGSVITGTLIGTIGIWSSYVCVTLAFVLSILSLLPIDSTPSFIARSQSMWKNLTVGLTFASRNGKIRMLLLLSLLMETFGFSYMVMMPVIARDVLEVGASGLGWLAAAGATGALLGTFSIASLGDSKAKSLILVTTAGLAGVSLILFSLSPWYAASLILAALIEASLMSYDATMATLLQLLSPDEMRARVMGLYTLTFGFTPLGGFNAGLIATVISAPFAVGLGGILILIYVLAIVTPARSRFAEPST